MCARDQGSPLPPPPPAFFAQAPLNSIWEGSGNVMCLDVLRAAVKEPESTALVVAEIQKVGWQSYCALLWTD